MVVGSLMALRGIRPTIDLHGRLGFRERARDIWAPGATFTGGVGVLFALERDEYARDADS